jgi:hypothetical protein
MHSRTEAMSLVKQQSKVTSIFLLTSIFNESIHSSIAVFYVDRIHEQWKGRIETWQQRKKVVRKRRAARRSNCSSATKTGDAQASPSFFLWLRSKPLRRAGIATMLLRLIQRGAAAYE